MNGPGSTEPSTWNLEDPGSSLKTHGQPGPFKKDSMYKKINFAVEWLANLRLRHNEIVEVDGHFYRHQYSENTNEHLLTAIEDSSVQVQALRA
jgi:hypothetical protein